MPLHFKSSLVHGHTVSESLIAKTKRPVRMLALQGTDAHCTNLNALLFTTASNSTCFSFVKRQAFPLWPVEWRFSVRCTVGGHWREELAFVLLGHAASQASPGGAPPRSHHAVSVSRHSDVDRWTPCRGLCQTGPRAANDHPGCRFRQELNNVELIYSPELSTTQACLCDTRHT